MLHLSRGQQQKVAVARAFLSAPRLMLLDEPTTGLDPRSKREVQAFIAEVRRESQTTILLTTHDMDEAEQLCDRIGFLSGGKLVAEGTPLELRKQVAAGRPLEEVDMETVFIELTGRSIEEDEDEDEGANRTEEVQRMTTIELVRARPPSRVGLGWAFFERQTNLWKRYWAWELVWLALRGGQHPRHYVHRQRSGPSGTVRKGEVSRLTMFLLIGTLVWAYLSAILDDMSLTIMWERWEGTIEHTLMAPVPRVVHLIGMSAFGVLHALLRTILIMVVRAAVLPRRPGGQRIG